MNWYKHYMGDYARDTAHLTILQHGTYRLLLDHYYATEKPLQADIPTLQRIIRATTLDEQDAVKTVLKEYFCLEGEFYTHSRADKELTKYEAQVDHNRTVGKLGGRPKNPEITQVVILDNPSGSKNITRKEPNPDTRYQIPDNQILETREQIPEKEKPVFVLPEWIDSELWTEWMSIRKKLKAVNSLRAMDSLVDKLFAISQSGISVNTALKTAIEKSWKSIELDWLSNQKKGKKDVYAQFLEGTKNEII